MLLRPGSEFLIDFFFQLQQARHLLIYKMQALIDSHSHSVFSVLYY